MPAKANVRVEVRQYGDPMIALKAALLKLRKQAAPVMRTLREKEFFMSESRRRRAKQRKTAFMRKAVK